MAMVPFQAANVADITDSSGGAAANGTIGAVTAPTDSSGGTADGTISAVGATNSGDVSATINANSLKLLADGESHGDRRSDRRGDRARDEDQRHFGRAPNGKAHGVELR